VPPDTQIASLLSRRNRGRRLPNRNMSRRPSNLGLTHSPTCLVTKVDPVMWPGEPIGRDGFIDGSELLFYWRSIDQLHDLTLFCLTYFQPHLVHPSWGCWTLKDDFPPSIETVTDSFPRKG
jgi:hypothetical protein